MMKSRTRIQVSDEKILRKRGVLENVKSKVQYCMVGMWT